MSPPLQRRRRSTAYDAVVPLTRWQPPAVRHDVDDDGRVGWTELFFDLIYVAALIQLGDRLSDEVSLAGFARFAGAFVVLWWTWTGTTAAMNRFAMDDVVHRLLLFAQMFAVGNFALVAVAPIENRTAWMALAYVGARVPLLIMYARVRTAIPTARTTADTYLRWFGAGAALWLISALVPEPIRLILWAVALAVEFGAPILVTGREDPTPTHEEHFRERYALFTIIVLGESFVKILSELAEVGLSPTTQVLGAGTFVVTVAMWWTYFDDVAESPIRDRSALADSSSRNRLIWVYGHLPLTLALTAYGVASKKVVVVDSLGDALSSNYADLLFTALVLALVAVALLDGVTVSPHFSIDERTRVGSRLVAASVLVGVRFLVGPQAVWLLTTVVAVVLTAQIAAEVLLARRADRRIDQRVEEDLEERRGSCDHLDAARWVAPSERICHDCVALGQRWVRLRTCLACGHVGCCDDSPGQHARQHFVDEDHPVMASAEVDERWTYCFVDDIVAPGDESRP